jgi:hypothetical protein
MEGPNAFVDISFDGKKWSLNITFIDGKAEVSVPLTPDQKDELEEAGVIFYDAQNS